MLHWELQVLYWYKYRYCTGILPAPYKHSTSTVLAWYWCGAGTGLALYCMRLGRGTGTAWGLQTSYAGTVLVLSGNPCHRVAWCRPGLSLKGVGHMAAKSEGEVARILARSLLQNADSGGEAGEPALFGPCNRTRRNMYNICWKNAPAACKVS